MIIWGDQRKHELSNFWWMPLQLGCSQNLCLSHKFLCAKFFALILEQCSRRGVGRPGPSLHQRERKFGRFSRILLEDPSCFQSNSELNLHFASAKMFDDAHSHENHWEKKTAWIVFLEKKRMNSFRPPQYLHVCSYSHIYRVFFFTGPPPKKLKYGKPRLSAVRCI